MDQITAAASAHDRGGAVEAAYDEKALPDENAQKGVQDVEAVTLSWSKSALIAVFIKYVQSTMRAT